MKSVSSFYSTICLLKCCDINVAITSKINHKKSVIPMTCTQFILSIFKILFARICHVLSIILLHAQLDLQSRAFRRRVRHDTLHGSRSGVITRPLLDEFCKGPRQSFVNKDPETKGARGGRAMRVGRRAEKYSEKQTR